MSESRPICWIVAGPNGAGKTTFALEYLPNVAGCRNFVNADLMAAGLSPLAPEAGRLAAGRLFLQEIDRHVAQRQDFGFETTLAGRGQRVFIRRLKRAGWRVELVYLALPSAQMAVLRVAERVRHGGHDIPVADIERRFVRSLRNLFDTYLVEVDRVICLMNAAEKPSMVFSQEGGQRNVGDMALLELLERAGRG